MVARRGDRFFVALVACALLDACARPEVTPAGADEAAALAHVIEDRVAHGDVALDLFSFDDSIDRATTALEVSSWRAWIRKEAAAHGVKKGMRDRSPAKGLVDDVAHGGYAGLLRVRTVGDRPSALFHYVTPDGGVGYIDFVVAKVGADARVVDFVDGATCEPYVQSALATSLAVADDGATGLDGIRAARDGADKLGVFTDAIKAKRWPDALARYRELPDRLQRQRPTLMMRYAAATHVGGAELLASIEAIRAAGTPAQCAELLAIDAEIAAGDYAGAQKSLDAVDAAVGGDPLLDFVRANVATRFGRADDAEAARARLRTSMPAVAAQLLR